MEKSIKKACIENLLTVFQCFYESSDKFTAATLNFDTENRDNSVHVIIMRGHSALKFSAMLAVEDMIKKLKNTEINQEPFDIKAVFEEYINDKETYIQKMRQLFGE